MCKQTSILLVEDNRKLLGVVRRMLELKGYGVRSTVSVAGARRAIEASPPDLVVLDVMLSDGNGIDFCRELRKTSDVPVLFLTALSRTESTVKALRAGGDDYLTKPFDFDELEARIEALLRRAAREPEIEETVPKSRSGAFGASQSATPAVAKPLAASPLGESLRLDPESRCAYMENGKMTLGAMEFSVLKLLLEAADGSEAGRSVAPGELYEAAWKMPPGGDLRPVKQCIYLLRRRIAESGLPLRLEHKRGVGYRLERCEEAGKVP